MHPIWVCPRDNSLAIQARTTKFGPEVQNTLVKIPIVLGLIELGMSNLTNFQNPVYLHRFCVFEIFVRPCATESVLQPKWLRTNMFAHSVVSWTVKQSICIFSVTIAGFESSTRRLAMDFQCFCRLSLNYTYLTCRNVACQHSVMVETALKLHAFAFNVFDLQNVLGNPVLFLVHLNIRQTSCRDSARLCSPCKEVGVLIVSLAPWISCHWVLWSHREGTRVCRFKSVPT